MAAQLHLAFSEPAVIIAGCLNTSRVHSMCRSTIYFRRIETNLSNGANIFCKELGYPRFCHPLRSSEAIKASGASKGQGSEISFTSPRLRQLDHHDFPYMDHSAHGKVTQEVYSDSKGWPKSHEDQAGGESEVLLAKLLLVAAMASDRGEIHAIIASQRDNWNKLFQGTLRLATISAAILSALNGGSCRCLSLSLAAALVDLGSVGMMSVINQFQPSQLAEEQRTAARLFRDLEKDIDMTLKISRKLREDFSTFLESRIERLHMLDKAYPIPLTPGGLEKFPKVIAPTQLSPCVDQDNIPEIPVRSLLNGWTSELAEDLKNTAKLIEEGDIGIYLSWGKTALKFNKIFAIAAPLLAAAAGALSIVDALDILNVSVFAACFSIASMFANSFSHDMQLGMIFELYRNAAGYFADISTSIHRNLRVPVEKRENGAIFHQKIAMKLGRRDQIPILSAMDKTAGSLF